MPSEIERALREAVIKVENDRTLWNGEWQIWLLDARAALASLPDRTGEPVALSPDPRAVIRDNPSPALEYLSTAELVAASPPDAEQARLRERVAELEAEIARARLLASHERDRFFAAEARLAQAERAPAVTGDDTALSRSLRTIADAYRNDIGDEEADDIAFAADRILALSVNEKAAYLKGRQEWIPASILKDEARTERDWQEAKAALAEPQQAVTEPDFHRWWGASKYRQVIFADERTRQIALDGWNAALEAALRTSSTGGKG